MTGPEVRQIGPGVCGSRLPGWAAAVRNRAGRSYSHIPAICSLAP